MKKCIILLFLAITLTTTPLLAHCQIPCGIFSDKIQFSVMREHIITIEKSMKQIILLSQAKVKNYNQIVRWIKNKEDHANKLDYIITHYFLAQRVKFPAKNKKASKLYISRLVSLHRLLVFSMKTKQSTNLELIKKLRITLERFEKLYFVDKKHNHSKKHHHKH